MDDNAKKQAKIADLKVDYAREFDELPDDYIFKKKKLKSSKYDPYAFDRVEAKAALIYDEVDKLIESSSLSEEELDIIYEKILTALSDIQDLYLMLDEVVEKIKAATDELFD